MTTDTNQPAKALRGYNVERISPSAVVTTWPRLEAGDVGDAYTVPADLGDLSITFGGDFGAASGSDVVSLIGEYGDGIAVNLGSASVASSWHVPRVARQPVLKIWPVVAPGAESVLVNAELICSRPAR